MKEITASVNPLKYPVMHRKYQTALCRLRIGHARLTHGFLMAGENQPFCEDCLVPLTVRHLLVECPSLRDLRRQLFTWARGRDGDFLISKILGEDIDYGNLFCFIERANFLNEI